MQCSQLHRDRGATILEIVVSIAVVVLFFSGVFLMDSRVLGLLRGSLESTASSRTLHDRAELLRGSTWTQVTDAAFHSGTLFATGPACAGALGNLTETVSVTAYLAAPGTVTPIQVTRNAAGTITTNSAGDPDLVDEPSVRVDLTTSWTAKGGRPRMRQLSLFFGEGGISGRK
jgi:hypothetical protein